MAGSAELAWDGSNPDVRLLYDINGLARRAPRLVDRTVELVAQYGCLALLLVLCAAGWWLARRRPRDPTAMAGLLWSLLAGVVALLLNIPIRDLVRRPHPESLHHGLTVLSGGRADYSFASDHATLAMAIAVGLFLVSARLGLVALLVAVVQGVTRIYLGLHYPSDVVGGFALGAATTLLLAPLAMALLTPVVAAVAHSRFWSLVSDRRSTGPSTSARPADVAQPGEHAVAGPDDPVRSADRGGSAGENRDDLAA